MSEDIYPTDDDFRQWAPGHPDDVEYADEDEVGQLALGVPGEQRAIPTLAPRPPHAECLSDVYRAGRA